MANQTEEELRTAYKLLEEGKPEQAKAKFTELYSYNLGSQELKFALFCCNYWLDLIQKIPETESFEHGEGLISKWKNFLLTIKEWEDSGREFFEQGIFHFQTGIFSTALKIFSSLEENEHNPAQKMEIVLKKAVCYKKLGQYEDALNTLEEISEYSAHSAQILSEMADCYALCGMEKHAKVLFREAFFIDAQKVDLLLLDSKLISCLVKQVEKKGCKGAALHEWIPVYGVIYGIFNVKRELKSQEVGRLKQEIYARENEIKNPASDTEVLIPKLINMYFWLIDYYVQAKEGSRKINDILLKIKIIDSEVYELYTK